MTAQSAWKRTQPQNAPNPYTDWAHWISDVPHILIYTDETLSAEPIIDIFVDYGKIMMWYTMKFRGVFDVNNFVQWMKKPVQKNIFLAIIPLILGITYPIATFRKPHCTYSRPHRCGTWTTGYAFEFILTDEHDVFCMLKDGNNAGVEAMVSLSEARYRR